MILYLAGSMADQCAKDARLDEYSFGTLHTFMDHFPKGSLKWIPELPPKEGVDTNGSEDFGRERSIEILK